MVIMDNESAQLDEEELIERVLRGQRELFGVLVERYWTTAVALAVCKSREPAAAEDLAQNSFVKAYTHLGSLRDRRRFGGWLSRIVVQECRTHHRRQKVRSRVGSLDLQTAEPAFACAARDNPGLTREQIVFIHDCVRTLPEKSQEIVLMRFVGGFSVGQIADQLGRDAGTVRVRLHRALKMLREQLAPILEEVQL